MISFLETDLPFSLKTVIAPKLNLTIQANVLTRSLSSVLNIPVFSVWDTGQTKEPKELLENSPMTNLVFVIKVISDNMDKSMDMAV